MLFGVSRDRSRTETASAKYDEPTEPTALQAVAARPGRRRARGPGRGVSTSTRSTKRSRFAGSSYCIVCTWYDVIVLSKGVHVVRILCCARDKYGTHRQKRDRRQWGVLWTWTGSSKSIFARCADRATVQQ